MKIIIMQLINIIRTNRQRIMKLELINWQNTHYEVLNIPGFLLHLIFVLDLVISLPGKW